MSFLLIKGGTSELGNFRGASRFVFSQSKLVWACFSIGFWMAFCLVFKKRYRAIFSCKHPVSTSLLENQYLNSLSSQILLTLLLNHSGFLLKAVKKPQEAIFYRFPQNIFSAYRKNLLFLAMLFGKPLTLHRILTTQQLGRMHRTLQT